MHCLNQLHHRGFNNVGSLSDSVGLLCVQSIVKDPSLVIRSYCTEVAVHTYYWQWAVVKPSFRCGRGLPVTRIKWQVSLLDRKKGRARRFYDL